MATRVVRISGISIIILWVTGCAGVARLDLVTRTGGNAALFSQFQAYDGHTGRRISFAEVIRRCRTADIVLFGEQHNDTVCNQLEAQLLYALADERRPVALALEFFEVDTQATLDAYLRGRIEESPFRDDTRQGRAYVRSHRPLIELCRAARIPVLAANAPRRLVRAFRKSDLDYETYRAELEPDEQCWLPVQNEYLGGSYEERFTEMMGDHGPAAPPPAMTTTKPTPTSQPATAPASAPATAPTTAPATAPATMDDPEPMQVPVSQPATATAPASQPAFSVESFYRAQLLWDQAMAETLVNFRDRYYSHRIMLIVGVFHVAHAGGTATKFSWRRPDDHVVTIVYRGTTDNQFTFVEEDRHAGDVVIYGIIPPPEESSEKPQMPTMMTAPATQPATTAPATQPTTSTAPATSQPRHH